MKANLDLSKKMNFKQLEEIQDIIIFVNYNKNLSFDMILGELRMEIIFKYLMFRQLKDKIEVLSISNGVRLMTIINN